MKNTPFGRVTRSIRWLRLALFGMVPLLIVLVGGLYWGTQRIVAEQQEKLTVHFSLLVQNIDQHESFLWRLQDENARLAVLRFSDAAFLQQMPSTVRPGWRLYRGQEQGVHLPFSLICAAQDCPDRSDDTWGVGQYLTDAFTSFWSTAPLPSGDAFLLDLDRRLSVATPGIGSGKGGNLLTETRLLAVDNRIRQTLIELSAAKGGATGLEGREILWLRTPDLPDSMIGVIRAPIQAQTWHSETGRPAETYAATLLKLERTALYEIATGKPSYDEFWLTHRDQAPLVGVGDVPATGDPGPRADQPVREYTLEGLVFRFKSGNGRWDAYYRVTYARLFSDYAGLGIALGVLLLGLGGMAVFARGYDRRVIAPAITAQRDLMDSEAFNRAIIDTTPVALCMLDRGSGRLEFGNPLARQWLGLAETDVDADNAGNAGAFQRLRQRLAQAAGPGTLDGFEAQDGKVLQVAYAPTRYRKQDVILCAFTDVSAHAEIERTLARARREADRASAAKSTFLATMSHEIRTPLYGVLGTLELLELTPLNEEQRRQLQTIQNSSAVLLQIISDILDTTRIETGQLALDVQPFASRPLVEDAVAAYAAMARQKGLRLFAIVDTGVPAWLRGDPARIRQILDNLISNAIKFTETGHVIVRLRVEGGTAGAPVIGVEVEDTGVGIAEEDQAQLFDPFYQVDAASHTLRGAGLGLSICMRLARLMEGRLELDSLPGRGSRFLLTLPLATEAGADEAPDLAGARVHVRAGHPELAGNLCAWFAHWGALASPVEASVGPIAPIAPDDLLVEVLLAPDAVAMEWPGPRIVGLDAGEMAGAGQVAVDGHHLDELGQAIDAQRRGETVASTVRAASNPARLGLRVLVAEDNPINRATLDHQLKQLGCVVVTASDGEQALARWREGVFDIVLTDVNMPRFNGYELTSTLRREGVAVPIIGVTANALRDEEQRCRDAGMTAWLVKPIGLRGLWALLHRHAPKANPLAGVDASPPMADESPLPPQYADLFVDTMRADAASVRAAMERGESAQAAATLHRMRGALAIMGMADLVARFERAEARLRGGQEGATPLGDEVATALAALDAALPG